MKIKMKRETRNCLLVSILIVLALLFVVYGDEMASATAGKSEVSLRVNQNENITINYDYAMINGTDYCEVTIASTYWDLYMPNYTETHRYDSNEKIQGQFKSFKFDRVGNYTVFVERYYHGTNGHATVYWSYINVTVVKGSAGSGSSGTGITIISDESGNGSQVEIISSDGEITTDHIKDTVKKADSIKKAGYTFRQPQTFKELVSWVFNPWQWFDWFKLLLFGHVSLADVISEWLTSFVRFTGDIDTETITQTIRDILAGNISVSEGIRVIWEALTGTSLDNLLGSIYYLIVVVGVLAVAVLVVYVILKLFIMKKMTGGIINVK